MTKFQGLLGHTFGGFVTIRGTAKFSDIVKFSEAKDYQRKTIPKHLEEISNYYNERENLFFPEVILSLELEYDFSKTDAISGTNPIQDTVQGKKFKSNVNDVEIQPLAKRHENDKLRVVNVILNNENAKCFGRIDGNHRLTAHNIENIYNEEIPFCIVLFESPSIALQEKMLFFNINSKSEPLTTEETLKSIFEDSENFPDEHLKTSTSFGWAYYYAKQLKQDEINRYFTNLSDLFDGKFLTTFLKLFKLLLEYEILENNESEIDKVRSALTYINTNIYSNRYIKNSKNTAVFSAFLFYQLQKPELINFLKDWVIKNEIYKIEELEASSIIKIMDNIASHKVKKVFVAMPYWSHAKVSEYNRLFKEALEEVQRTTDLPFTLELFPIMRDQGESQRIDEKLLNQIRECDVFIADLTGANVNVIYETAFAEGIGIPSILIKKENDLDAEGNEITLPFDMDKRQYKPYTEDAYYTKIQSIIKHNLPTILHG